MVCVVKYVNLRYLSPEALPQYMKLSRLYICKRNINDFKKYPIWNNFLFEYDVLFNDFIDKFTSKYLKIVKLLESKLIFNRSYCSEVDIQNTSEISTSLYNSTLWWCMGFKSKFFKIRRRLFFVRCWFKLMRVSVFGKPYLSLFSQSVRIESVNCNHFKYNLSLREHFPFFFILSLYMTIIHVSLYMTIIHVMS